MFKRVTKDDTIRAEWWEKGVTVDGEVWEENITLRPILTYTIQQQAARKGLTPPKGISMEAFQKADAQQVLAWSNEVETQKALILAMTLESNLFYEPSEEQAARGEHGDKRDLDDAALNDMGANDIEFILEEVNKRAKSLKKEAEEGAQEGFQPEVPTANDIQGEIQGPN